MLRGFMAKSARKIAKCHVCGIGGFVARELRELCLVLSVVINTGATAAPTGKSDERYSHQYHNTDIIMSVLACTACHHSPLHISL